MCTFLNWIYRVFHYWYSGYPRDAWTLLYVCKHNGITGVVRAEDYDRELGVMRGFLNRNLAWPKYPVRPQVYPVFLFSDKTPGTRSFLVGTLADLDLILQGQRFALEERSFELPPINAPGSTPFGYGITGWWEEIGREGTRHRHYTLEQAKTYLERR